MTAAIAVAEGREPVFRAPEPEAEPDAGSMPAPEPAKESEGTSGPDVIGSISGA